MLASWSCWLAQQLISAAVPKRDNRTSGGGLTLHEQWLMCDITSHSICCLYCCGCRASPLPGVTDIEQDPLAPDSSVEATPAVHTAAAAAYPSQHHAAPGLAEYSPEVYADAQAEGVMGMGPEGLMLAGSYDDLEGAGVEGDERSRAIAEQLAQLHVSGQG